jgi:uncharacterized protein (DUF1778 family)
MTTNPQPARPSRVQINLRLPEELLDLLDADARGRYLTRNDLVVQILNARYRSADV